MRQKHMLSSRTEVKICSQVESKQVIVPVSRDLLASLTKPLMTRVEKLTLETFQNAKVDIIEVKHVLLIGGSSRLPSFQETVAQMFGRDRIAGGQVSPDLAVAEGAVIHAIKAISTRGHTVVGESLQAIPMPAITHTDVMPHSLGVAVQDRVSSAKYCSVILERNTPIPCRVTKQFGSVRDDQTRFQITPLQGENGQVLKDCLVVFDKELEFPARSSSKPSLELTLGYDASGMLTATIHDLVSGKTEDIVTQFFANKTR